MLIGELASKSGFSRDTIRYYEKRGLLQVAALDRRENNYKNYSPHVLQRLAQIRQFKAMGFTLAESARLFKDFENINDPCSELPLQLDEKIALLDEKMKLLAQHKSKLLELRKACDGSCGSDQGLPDCFESR